ncbi:glycosyltransferase [Candidatus Hydrogenedentota bacterium]
MNNQPGKPRVSVIIPVFNRGKLLLKAVDSILAQTFSDFEIIIVDDGSTDNTADVAASITDPRVRFARLKKNQGLSAARNKGVDLARGEFVAYLDSDDEYLPEKLEKQVATLSKLSADVGIAYSDTIVVYSDGREVLNRAAHISADEGPAHPDMFDMRGGGIFPQTILMRRHFALKIRWDPSFRAEEDIDFFVRLRRACRFHHIDAPLFKYYIGTEGAITNRSYSRIKGRFKLMHKHWNSLTSTSSTLKCNLDSIDFYWPATTTTEQLKTVGSVWLFTLKKGLNKTMLGYSTRIFKKLLKTMACDFLGLPRAGQDYDPKNRSLLCKLLGLPRTSRVQSQGPRIINAKYYEPRLRELVNCELELMKRYITDGQTVLDCGCGDGRNGFRVVDDLVLSPKTVILLEPDAKAIAQAKANIERAPHTRGTFQPLRGSIFALPFTENRFDAVIAYGDVLSLAPSGSIEAGLRQIAALLKPGGALLFSIVTKEYLLSVAKERERPDKQLEITQELKYTQFDANYSVVRCASGALDIEETLRDNGFKLREMQDVHINSESVVARYLIAAIKETQ